ncbi:rifin [Plasmodium reichenowi]|uniref:Rifin n=1 Tax=Plasmodium reichenowi TaxID=5854 RepID=A0A060RLU8_PLARE|nr:rifin [Plasmodium reichenowi]
MKVHYINILMFSLPLNILVNTHKKNPSITQNTTNRTLCECELYVPANYDNDPQMKKVMDNFNKETQQRLREYDDRMVEKRKQCKEQCDKEIQKIILKDKLEKELTEKFATLQTDIQNDAIPTCICEKSLADKTEKFCLNCGKTMGGVAPGWGLVSGLMYAEWINAAMEAAAQKGIEEGVKYGIEELSNFFVLNKLIPISQIQSLINPANYFKKMTYVMFTQEVKISKCSEGLNSNSRFCQFASYQKPQDFVKAASSIADNAKMTAELAEEEAMKAAAPALSTYSNAIIASIVAIVVIVLIMVIIYKILRYRRKKKMKKKLQYIKLLEE